MIEVIHTLIVC